MPLPTGHAERTRQRLTHTAALTMTVGAAVTVIAAGASFAAWPYVVQFTFEQAFATHTTATYTWFALGETANVFVLCLFAGIAQASLLARAGVTRWYLALPLTAAGAALSWWIQEIADSHDVSGYPLSGHGGLFGFAHSTTIGPFLLAVALGFGSVGLAQALSMYRRPGLAVAWPAIWLFSGAFYAVLQLALPWTYANEIAMLVAGAWLGLTCSAALELSPPSPPHSEGRIVARAASGLTAWMGLGALALATYGAYFVTNGPVDDPTFFCADGQVAADAGSDGHLVVNECSAGRRYSIHRGDEIRLELATSHGVDTGSEWSDFGVSNPIVLATVQPLTPVVRGRGGAEVAVYSGRFWGESQVTAVFYYCSANGGGSCDRGHRWNIDVRVT